MLERTDHYLKHLIGLSVLMAGAAHADTIKNKNLELIVKGVQTENLRFWPNKAFPESTFVRIFIPKSVGVDPVVQIWQPDTLLNHPTLKARVEVIKGDPPLEPKGD